MDVKRYVSNVPDMERFLTVDELNEDFERIASDYPTFTQLARVGSSQLGEPISMLSIGSGSRNILLFACPHPNEPIGAMMVHHLARLLCDDASLRDALDVTWHLIPCADPDGTRLNEGWFSGPFTVRNFVTHYYRPSIDRQVEWTFPSFYKQNYFDRTLPESEMLMRVIDRLQPVLTGTLHNADFGGVYYYLSREEAALYQTFHELPAWEGLPLRRGEPEMPYAVEFAPAIYKLVSSEDTYNYLEANGTDMTGYSQGASSSEYSARYGTLTLLIEMAYFDDPRVSDTSLTGTNRRDAVLCGQALMSEGIDFVAAQMEAVRGDLKSESPFEDAVAWLVENDRASREANRQWASTDPATDRPATVAECFVNNQEMRFHRLLVLGMLVRMLEGEVMIGNGTPAIRSSLIEARSTFDGWMSSLELDLDVRAVPIRKLVGVQLGAVLAAALHVAGSDPSMAGVGSRFDSGAW